MIVQEAKAYDTTLDPLFCGWTLPFWDTFLNYSNGFGYGIVTWINNKYVGSIAFDLSKKYKPDQIGWELQYICRVGLDTKYKYFSFKHILKMLF